ncbi:MAG: nickel-binding protein [Cyclobacteriaceae bacterium]
MPLYMDIHTVDSDSFSVEDVVKAHMEDLAIQEQFGVTQLKYWVNVDAKTLFCLMKGPTIDACNEVHKQSHGNTACNIIEVSDDEFNLFLGKGNHIHDLAQTTSGKIDTGYRTILCITLLDFTKRHQLYVSEAYKIIEQHEGVVILQPQDEIMASFIYASTAIQCALSISTWLAASENVEYTIALSSGRPVDEKGNTLFELTKKKALYLCAAGLKNTIHLDNETNVLAEKENMSALPQHVKIIQPDDFNLLFGLFEVFDKNINASGFKSKSLYTALGWSKSQVYRKLNSLAGMAPNQLIQEVRLRQSLQRIKRGDQTIAEVAYNSGFNSPTYFTKVFRKRFGISPRSFAKNQG